RGSSRRGAWGCVGARAGPEGSSPHRSVVRTNRKNFLPLGFAVPQLGQASTAARGAAHSPQNFAPARLSQPQLWHFIGIASSRELFQQRLRVLRVGGVKPLGEVTAVRQRLSRARSSRQHAG